MAKVSVNGQIINDSEVKISPLSWGVSYGYGLFETILIAGGMPVFFDEHIQRMHRSAEFFNLSVPPAGIIGEWLSNLLKANNLREGRARIQLTALNETSGTGKLTTGLIISAREGVPYHKELYEKGVNIGILSGRKNHHSPVVKHKTMNYLENILGQREAAQKGWAEGLFLNHDGYLAEGTKSNIFLVKDKQLYTPDTDSGILPGITREKIIYTAGRQGIKVKEKKITVEELLNADECFICNSLMSVMPVASVDKRPVGSGGVGDITGVLMDAYNQYLHSG
ncbi:branched-subunit amino acid aminotransferase/4-amino-4-deoxychorismate lyase [Desulfohalotomaculum tongense]|uniref:aminotransferase class IV n=1 Tax=Desulforadius tongensis TaxID=1216062 RepID=UPI001955FE96|nr:aminotransferase class IV [Desulforadius tongensis]MBM7854593.1 branched-subunit amino acid aminotransferase/4-amino-4-deoxychorismate lyase [Desulforadius tongensis]